MNKQKLFGLFLSFFSFIGLLINSQIKTCLDSCSGCQSQNEMFIASFPTFFLIALFIFGIVLFFYTDNI